MHQSGSSRRGAQLTRNNTTKYHIMEFAADIRQDGRAREALRRSSGKDSNSHHGGRRPPVNRALNFGTGRQVVSMPAMEGARFYGSSRYWLFYIWYENTYHM